MIRAATTAFSSRQVLPLAGLVAAITLAAGCGDDNGSADSGVVVVATTTQVADLVRNVAGGRAEVRSMLRPDADPHDYEPRPSDVRAVAEAAVVFRSGGDLDGWLGDVLANAGEGRGGGGGADRLCRDADRGRRHRSPLVAGSGQRHPRGGRDTPRAHYGGPRRTEGLHPASQGLQRPHPPARPEGRLLHATAAALGAQGGDDPRLAGLLRPPVPRPDRGCRAALALQSDTGFGRGRGAAHGADPKRAGAGGLSRESPGHEASRARSLARSESSSATPSGPIRSGPRARMATPI